MILECGNGYGYVVVFLNNEMIFILLQIYISSFHQQKAVEKYESFWEKKLIHKYLHKWLHWRIPFLDEGILEIDVHSALRDF